MGAHTLWPALHHCAVPEYLVELTCFVVAPP